MPNVERRFQKVCDPVLLCYVSRVESDTADVDDYMRDIDRTLLRENLKLTFEQRAEKHLRALQFVEELRRAGQKLRQIAHRDER